MTRRQWTIDQLADLVRDSQIVARDTDAHSVALPSELTLVAVPDPRPWEEQLGRDHPTFVGAVVDNWRQALDRPGIVHDVTIKRCISDRWHDVEVTVLNLLHQPELGFVLISSRVGGETEPPEDPSSTEPSFTSPHCFVQHLDETATVLRIEGDVEPVFGRTAEELAGVHVAELLHPDDRQPAVEMWLDLISSPEGTRTFQQRAVRPDGSVVWLQSILMNRLDSTGTVLAVSHDISEQRAQQAALAANEQEMRFLTEAVPLAVFRAARSGEVTYGNARWSALFDGCPTLEDVFARLHDDDRGMLELACKEAAATRTGASCRVRNAGDRYLEFRLQGVGGPADSEIETGVIGTVDDVTSDVRQVFQLRASAEQDALTGLANRRGLTRKLEAAMASGHSTLVLFGDLDGFKEINDEFGHDVGDQVITGTGERLRQAVRPDDLVGRWGGDEFVIICGDVEDGDDSELVARLHRSLEGGVVVAGQNHRVRMSVGAVRPEPGEQGQDVLRRADTAMYEVKRSRA